MAMHFPIAQVLKELFAVLICRQLYANFKCIEDLVNVNESTSENIKDAISISEKLITVNGKDPSDIRVYNTAGLPVTFWMLYCVKAF